ncbi:MAG: helix-turn-helix domain-containing protein [Bacteroidales bacterium]|nr:helix-turn-helix domain-containing protein [Bacteroidales bacterium]
MVDKFLIRVDFLLAVFFCLSLSTNSIRAQTGAEDYLVIDRLTREGGLPDQDINGIYFDSKGYAWIGTFGGGLVRYDGDSFIKFSQKEIPGFMGDIVSHCHEDNFGRLWVPGAGGMDILDMESLAIMGDFPGMSKAWRRSHPPAALRTDSRGCMWFTSNNMLFRVAFSDDGGTFIVDSLLCNVTNDNLMPKACDVENDGSVWITLNGRFYKVRQIEGKGLRTSEILPDIFIGEDNRATAFLRFGNEVWIGTMNGLYRVDIPSGSYTCYLHTESDRHSLPNNEVTGLCLSPENEIVVGTLGGVCIYNPVSRSFNTYGSRTNDYGNQILPGEIVRSIATRNRQIWVGLEAEGLVILQRKGLQITNLSRIETTSSPIPSAPVRALFIDSNEVLWLATTGYGLCRQVGDLVFRNYNMDNSALLGNSITSFCEDGNGRIWVGTVDGHLNYINMSGSDVIHVPEGYRSDIARNIDVVLGMVYDDVNDYIWIMARNGLYIYDIGNSTFVESPVRTSACLGACIVSGKLLVSTLEGLWIIDLQTLESRIIDGFPASMSLVTDGDTIWAGTYGNGILKVDNCMSEKPDITVYSDSDGLADNQINGLLLDGVYLWITTENGLSRLDTQTGEINSYDMDDGLKSMSFCENSISKGSNGTIYMGLKGGGLSILRSSYVSSEYSNKPEVVISGYYSKDEFHNISLSDAISKDERDTDFTVKFSDLSYRKGADITYESRLLPMEKDWSPVFENDTHVKFGHIPGGNYRIQIRAVDRKGNVLSQDEKLLYVKPVLYKRWWFRLIALLLLGLMVNLFVRWYTRSINRKKDMLQQEVDRQTKELKEQKEELEKRAKELAEQNALLQKQNEMIASHNTLSSGFLSNKESDFSFKLLAAIQKKYKDPDLDVYGLAEAMGMSRSQLNEKIQQTLGQSIAQFIRTYRLNVAKEMICNGTNDDMNISEIAYEVGFNDPKYFTRCFTKEFNATPSDLHRKGKD